MDDFEKYQPQMAVQVVNPIFKGKSAVSELLEDSGNCMQGINLHLLSDSPFSEQQKLRHVLDWAHMFLSSGSEVHHEFCRPESLILANGNQSQTQRGSPVYKHSSAAKHHHQATCTVGSNEVFEGGQRMEKVWQLEPANYNKSEPNNRPCGYKLPFPDNPCIPFYFTSGRDEVARPEKRETPETKRNLELYDTTHKQKSSQDNISSLSNGNHRGKEQRDMMRANIKKKRGPKVEAEKDKTEAAWTEVREQQINNEQDSSSSFMMYGKDNKSHSKPEQTPKQMEKTINSNFSSPLKIPASLTIYEQYQLCVDHLRFRGCQQKPPCFEFDSFDPDAEIKKHPSKVSIKGLAAVESTKTFSAILNKNQERTTHKRNGSTLSGHTHLKTPVKDPPAAICTESRPVCEKKTVTSTTHLDFIKRAKNSNNRDFKTQTEHLWTTPSDNVSTVKDSDAFTANSVLMPKRVRHHPDMKGHQVDAKIRGHSRRLCEKSSLTNGGILPRPQSTKIITLNAQIHTKRHTPEDRVKHTSATGDGKTPDDHRPTSQATATTEQVDVDTEYKYNPAGVPESHNWLNLPDEVWLSILSVLPHGDLSRVVEVCHRLHTLATDHTLWKKVRIENSTVSDQWLLCVGRRHPRSLCLYSCSGLSTSSCGLEMFFSLCINSLEELKVISCCGPGLHGDLILPLIGQLCDRVTSVDVSWSGATDTGVKALSDGCAGLRLEAVVLNGCHVSDDALTKLVMRHKGSLCRLEVFGCQSLTPSCLQTIYKMFPGLQHLNIGKVPKVNTHSLTVMASQLKCLIFLNLTGLQAVTNVTVETLLQSCINLQSLTLSSCPGVTDLTLQSISKYTPCIRSLDVSGCKAVTDAGIESLALGCRSLQHLDVSSTDTGNRGVTLLANYCGTHLHTVKLSFCHISSENILKLCRGCKRLEVVHLYGCAQLPTEQEIREVNTTVKVYPLP